MRSWAVSVVANVMLGSVMLPEVFINIQFTRRAAVTRSARHSHSRVVQYPRSASSTSVTDFMQQQVVDSQQVVVGTNTPFHPHQPFSRRLRPRPRSRSGSPCESARDVNSTPLHFI